MTLFEFDFGYLHREGRMLCILLKFKDAEIKTIETEKVDITIGRNPNCDIHIDNLGVSKRHARIFKQDGEYVVEDLNSTNGTYVNDKRVARAIINDHDEIHIGKHSLLVRLKTPKGGDTDQNFGEKTMLLTK